MSYKIVSNNIIVKEYERFVSERTVNESFMDKNYLAIRIFCLDVYNKIKEIVSSKQLIKSSKHELDLCFGLKLYEFLNQQEDFNSKYESDYMFWKYLAVFVIPDIVADRWGVDKSAHFYKKATAIYPFQIYWYVHLSWQGDLYKTYEILKNNQEDQILQLVDRPSTIGVNLELYRGIMARVCFIPNEKKEKSFRTIMIRNTSSLVSTRPEIWSGGLTSYIDMLFENIEQRK